MQYHWPKDSVFSIQMQRPSIFEFFPANLGHENNCQVGNQFQSQG